MSGALLKVQEWMLIAVNLHNEKKDFLLISMVYKACIWCNHTNYQTTDGTASHSLTHTHTMCAYTHMIGLM